MYLLLKLAIRKCFKNLVLKNCNFWGAKKAVIDAVCRTVRDWSNAIDVGSNFLLHFRLWEKNIFAEGSARSDEVGLHAETLCGENIVCSLDIFHT